MNNRTTGRIESNLREALNGAARHDVREAIGWDDSQVSRFLSGQQGITIDRIEEMFNAIGISLVTRKYLDAMATLCEVGASCECARNGNGECGAKRL